MRPIIDEKLMYFAYYDDEPIGFYLMVPDLNGVIASAGRPLRTWARSCVSCGG